MYGNLSFGGQYNPSNMTLAVAIATGPIDPKAAWAGPICKFGIQYQPCQLHLALV